MSITRTALLLAALTALFLGAGYLIGGRGGMIIALGIAAVTNIVAYWNSDRMVLSMYGAREVDRQTAPEFYGLVARLAANAGLPMPRVYVIDSPQPNAFATGRDPQHAAVAATSGLLSAMNRDEVEGVMAHELAHVKHRDTLTMTVTATIAGAISMLANLAIFMPSSRSDDGRGAPLGGLGTILVMILGPIAAMLVQMAISRSREYEADAEGARIAGSPDGLAAALERLGELSGQVANPVAEANPATAHLFIVNPLRGGSPLSSLFSTHPDLSDRIARLRAMTPGRPSPTNRRRGPWG